MMSPESKSSPTLGTKGYFIFSDTGVTPFLTSNWGGTAPHHTHVQIKRRWVEKDFQNLFIKGHTGYFFTNKGLALNYLESLHSVDQFKKPRDERPTLFSVTLTETCSMAKVKEAKVKEAQYTCTPTSKTFQVEELEVSFQKGHYESCYERSNKTSASSSSGCTCIIA